MYGICNIAPSLHGMVCYLFRLPLWRKHPCSIQMKVGADGCDLVSSLEESVRNGDVDFGDSKLQQLYESYRQRLQSLKDLSKLRSHPQLV